MNTLVITQANRWFVIELGDQRLHLLNEKALRWNLKHVFKFDKFAITSIMAYLAQQSRVEINLDQVGGTAA